MPHLIDFDGIKSRDGKSVKKVQIYKDPEDEHLDVLDWYLKGIKPIEIGEWIETKGKGNRRSKGAKLSKKILNYVRQMAEVKGVSYEEMRLQYKQRHKSARLEVKGRLKAAGFRMATSGRKKKHANGTD